MCESGSGTSTGNLLYLKNTDYPVNIRTNETSCTCSVETTSCTSNINVYFVHFQLDDGSGSCTDTQKIIINDNGTDSTFTCSDNTYYSITQKLTSSGNYLTVSLENTAGVKAGYLFTGYEGRFISLQVRHALPLRAPITAKFVCVCRLLKRFRILYGKQ